MDKIEFNLDELDVGLVDLLIKAGQLRMYKHFEEQLARNGSITIGQYREQVKPVVLLLQEEIDKRIGNLDAYLIDVGLFK